MWKRYLEREDSKIVGTEGARSVWEVVGLGEELTPQGRGDRLDVGSEDGVRGLLGEPALGKEGLG